MRTFTYKGFTFKTDSIGRCKIEGFDNIFQNRQSAVEYVRIFKLTKIK